jgi:hypothetical protein
MIKDNVTPFKTPSTHCEKQTPTLAEVAALMQAWRLEKKTQNEKIPDEIWGEIFILLETMNESRVLSKLGIGQGQLLSKKLERQGMNSSSHKKSQKNEDEMESVEFCEVKPTYPLDYKPAKAFSTATSVVELYRPDGMLMKIHICTDRFEELLHAFFKG